MAFNSYANPKIETKRFKIYIDVGSSLLNPTWELQGRGVESWTVEQNQDINKTPDVLGYVDMERGTAQPTQSGVTLALRSGSTLATKLFDAFFAGDLTSLDSLNILQKFEFVDGAEKDTCKARLQKGCMIAINSFNGEAGGYLNFDVDIHYSNEIVTGTMPITDGSTIEFTPDDDDDDDDDDKQ